MHAQGQGPARQMMRRRYSPCTFALLFFASALAIFAPAVSAQETDPDKNPPTQLPRRRLVTPPEKFEPEDKPEDEDFQPFTDRWRIVPPAYEVNIQGSLLDPYNQNILKGDRPIFGNDIFLNLSASVDTL